MFRSTDSSGAALRVECREGVAVTRIRAQGAFPRTEVGDGSHPAF